MANAEHLAILKDGVAQWNRWRAEHPDVEIDFSEAALSMVDLCGAELVQVNFADADLHEANFVDANLSASNLSGADLSGANLSGTDLRLTDFSGADLVRATLSSARLLQARLVRANLSHAVACSTVFDSADLTRADLNGSHCAFASFRWANLTEADLSDCDVGWVNFSGANVLRANFGGMYASGVHFADIDLSGAENLQSVRHRSQSTVGIDTVYKSGGKIPEVFLRGCGVPDQFIAYIGSMVGRPIEFYSCFISYSTKDQEFADRLYADLQSKGVRCWFAPHDIRGGRKLHEQLDEAIRLHDKLLLILSEHSMNSNWVKTEIANGRAREQREKKQMLFPITLAPFASIEDWKLFDADRGIDSAREIREYYIPDFSKWKDHDSYQKAFQHLVRDLKSDAGG